MRAKPTHHQAHRKALIFLLCLLFCFVSTSCGSKESPQSTDTTNESNYPITGHLLYGYKHGLKVYGQYMDQAGDNNAMLLIFLKKDSDSSADAIISSVTINGSLVETSIQTEQISSTISALAISFTSSVTEVDELSKEDTASLTLSIIDSQSGDTLDVTNSISFPCN